MKKAKPTAPALAMTGKRSREQVEEGRISFVLFSVFLNEYLLFICPRQGHDLIGCHSNGCNAPLLSESSTSVSGSFFFHNFLTFFNDIYIHLLPV